MPPAARQMPAIHANARKTQIILFMLYSSFSDMNFTPTPGTCKAHYLLRAAISPILGPERGADKKAPEVSFGSF